MTLIVSGPGTKACGSDIVIDQFLYNGGYKEEGFSVVTINIEFRQTDRGRGHGDRRECDFCLTMN